MDGKRARSLMRGVAALALAMSLGTRWVYILIVQLSIHPPSFGSLFLPAPSACTSLSIIGAESIHILAVLAHSWVGAGHRSDASVITHRIEGPSVPSLWLPLPPGP